MRALVWEDRLRYVPDRRAPAPGPGECLVRVHLSGLCGTDLQIVNGYLGFRGVPGHEFVGTVVGGSPAWQGRRVVGEINCVCGTCDLCTSGLSNHCRTRKVIGIVNHDGCLAEFLAIPERNLHAVPDALSDEEAVFTEPLAAAYQVLAQCPVSARTRTAVVGSGRLGLLVAQVLATSNSRPVVIGRNRHKLLMAEKKGLQSHHVDDLAPRADFDVVVDCTGTASGLELSAGLVRPRGTLVLKSTHVGPGANLASIVVNEIRLIGSRCGPFPTALAALARQAVDVRSMISRVFPLDRGLDAFASARSPEVMKVLIKP